MGLAEEQVREIYTRYAEQHKKSARFFIEQVRLVAGPILDHEGNDPDYSVTQTEDLIVSAAIIGGLSRLLAEKLMLLDGKDLSNGGSIRIRGEDSSN